jgi:hypothetical protein
VRHVQPVSNFDGLMLLNLHSGKNYETCNENNARRVNDLEPNDAWLGRSRVK